MCKLVEADREDHRRHSRRQGGIRGTRAPVVDDDAAAREERSMLSILHKESILLAVRLKLFCIRLPIHQIQRHLRPPGTANAPEASQAESAQAQEGHELGACADHGAKAKVDWWLPSC